MGLSRRDCSISMDRSGPLSLQAIIDKESGLHLIADKHWYINLVSEGSLGNYIYALESPSIPWIIHQVAPIITARQQSQSSSLRFSIRKLIVFTSNIFNVKESNAAQAFSRLPGRAGSARQNRYPVCRQPQQHLQRFDYPGFHSGIINAGGDNKNPSIERLSLFG